MVKPIFEPTTSEFLTIKQAGIPLTENSGRMGVLGCSSMSKTKKSTPDTSGDSEISSTIGCKALHGPFEILPT